MADNRRKSLHTETPIEQANSALKALLEHYNESVTVSSPWTIENGRLAKCVLLVKNEADSKIGPFLEFLNLLKLRNFSVKQDLARTTLLHQPIEISTEHYLDIRNFPKLCSDFLETKGISSKKLLLQKEKANLNEKLTILKNIVSDNDYWSQKDNPDAIDEIKKILIPISKQEGLYIQLNDFFQNSKTNDTAADLEVWQFIKRRVVDSMESTSKKLKALLFSIANKNYRHPDTQKLYDAILADDVDALRDFEKQMKPPIDKSPSPNEK